MIRAPRPHQDRALAMLRTSVGGGCTRPMLKIATGGGKTFVAAMIITSARQRGKSVVFIVDAITLIDQTVEAFYAESIRDLGVIQADHPMTDLRRPVQIASVQTLQRRGMPPADIVIVDEAHCRHEWLEKLMASEEWAKTVFIGLSATPWSRGLGNIYGDLICPISMADLISEGLLSPFRVYAAAHPDLTGVKTVAGDYHEGQLAEVMSEGGLIANIVDTWRRRGEGRPTVVFAVDRAHAAKIQGRFHEAGIGCGYIDCFTERAERTRIRDRLAAGEIKVVANVGCLTKGVDWALGCIVLARPTKSEILYVQMVGRGLRVNAGIPDCIILDHADNTLRMGFVTDVDARNTILCTAAKGERQAQPRKEALPKECPSCTFLKPPKTRECPACGFEPERTSEIEEHDGELVEITTARLKADRAEKQRWHSQLRFIAKQRGYSSGWVAQTYRKRFGVWPRGLDMYRTTQPEADVRNYVTSTLIRYAKRSKAA